MGKFFAIPGSSLVDCALIPIKKHAAGFDSLQDHLAICAGHRVLLDKRGRLNAQEFRQVFDVTLGELDFCDATAFGAFAAIDLVVNFFSGTPKLPLHPFVRFEVFAEAQILGAVLLSHATNLHQICDHIPIIVIIVARSGDL